MWRRRHRHRAKVTWACGGGEMGMWRKACGVFRGSSFGSGEVFFSPWCYGAAFSSVVLACPPCDGDEVCVGGVFLCCLLGCLVFGRKKRGSCTFLVQLPPGVYSLKMYQMKNFRILPSLWRPRRIRLPCCRISPRSCPMPAAGRSWSAVRR